MDPDPDQSLWFVGKDVCDILDLSDVNKAAQNLDPDEKDTKKVRTLCGEQDMIVVNESGLCTLVIRSNKPQAKPFRKWVTSEVLPPIRKSGCYHREVVNPHPKFPPRDPDRIEEELWNLSLRIARLEEQMRGALPPAPRDTHRATRACLPAPHPGPEASRLRALLSVWFETFGPAGGTVASAI